MQTYPITLISVGNYGNASLDRQDATEANISVIKYIAAHYQNFKIINPKHAVTYYTGQEILDTLKSSRDYLLNNPGLQCHFLFIFAHGLKDILISSDGKAITHKHIGEIFNLKYAKTIYNIPISVASLYHCCGPLEPTLNSQPILENNHYINQRKTITKTGHMIRLEGIGLSENECKSYASNQALIRNDTFVVIKPDNDQRIVFISEDSEMSGFLIASFARVLDQCTEQSAVMTINLGSFISRIKHVLRAIVGFEHNALCEAVSIEGIRADISIIIAKRKDRQIFDISQEHQRRFMHVINRVKEAEMSYLGKEKEQKEFQIWSRDTLPEIIKNDTVRNAFIELCDGQKFVDLDLMIKKVITDVGERKEIVYKFHNQNIINNFMKQLDSNEIKNRVSANTFAKVYELFQNMSKHRPLSTLKPFKALIIANTEEAQAVVESINANNDSMHNHPLYENLILFRNNSTNCHKPNYVWFINFAKGLGYFVMNKGNMSVHVPNNVISTDDIISRLEFHLTANNLTDYEQNKGLLQFVLSKLKSANSAATLMDLLNGNIYNQVIKSNDTDMAFMKICNVLDHYASIKNRAKLLCEWYKNFHISNGHGYGAFECYIRKRSAGAVIHALFHGYCYLTNYRDVELMHFRSDLISTTSSYDIRDFTESEMSLLLEVYQSTGNFSEAKKRWKYIISQSVDIQTETFVAHVQIFDQIDHMCKGVVQYLQRCPQKTFTEYKQNETGDINEEAIYKCIKKAFLSVSSQRCVLLVNILDSKPNGNMASRAMSVFALVWWKMCNEKLIFDGRGIGDRAGFSKLKNTMSTLFEDEKCVTMLDGNFQFIDINLFNDKNLHKQMEHTSNVSDSMPLSSMAQAQDTNDTTMDNNQFNIGRD